MRGQDRESGSRELPNCTGRTSSEQVVLPRGGAPGLPGGREGRTQALGWTRILRSAPQSVTGSVLLHQLTPAAPPPPPSGAHGPGSAAGCPLRSAGGGGRGRGVGRGGNQAGTSLTHGLIRLQGALELERPLRGALCCSAGLCGYTRSPTNLEAWTPLQVSERRRALQRRGAGGAS